MEQLVLGVLFAIAISFTEYFSKKLNLRHKKYYYQIVSLTAGVSLSYLLLELFPLFAENAFEIGKPMFLFLLLGFIAHHVIEKEIYQHNRMNELVKNLSLEQQIFYYVYHVIIGIVLIILMTKNTTEGIFFAVSILAFTVVSNLPSEPHKSKYRMLFLSTSTLVGSILSLFFWRIISKQMEFALIGLVAGVLLFTVTRHHIPQGKVGNVGFFIFGVLVYSTLIVSKWFL